MKSQRLSLSSPELTGRMRSYDRYVHNANRSFRDFSMRPSPNNMKPAQSLPTKQAPTVTPKTVKPVNTNPAERTVQPVTAQVSTSTSRAIALQSVQNSQAQTDANGSITRQFTDEAVVEYALSKNKYSRIQKLLYGLSGVVVMLALAVSVQSFVFNQKTQEQAAALGVSTDEQGVSEGTGSEPSEEVVSSSAIAAYQVRNPEDPRYIRIPDLRIMARIKQVGVDNTGAVDAPGNINDTAWYTNSARPGSQYGSSLLVGHVSGWTASGVFKNLDDLKAGSIVEVEKGNGEKVQYMVKQVTSVAVDQIDMSEILTPDNPNDAELNLMTCSGKYNRENDTYEERLIVQAIKI